MPTGRLIRKIGRQPRPNRSHSVSSAPSSGPDTAPRPTIAPKSPNTLPRSCAGKVAWTIDRTCGTIIAAMAPWRMREATSISGFAAKPQRAEARVKPPMPTRKSRLRPWMSPSRPPVTRPAAKASAYPAVIHWIWLKEAPASRWIDGIATLTIVTSTRSMKAAVITMARANQRRRSGTAVAAGRCFGGGHVFKLEPH